MKLINLFEIFLIILLPLTLPLVWWLLISTTTSKIFLITFVIQSVLALSLFLLRKRINSLSQNIKSQLQFTVNEKFSSLYERSPVPYIITNLAGDIVLFNPASIKLFESTTDTLGGLNFYDLVSMKNEDELTVVIGKISSGITVDDIQMKLQTVAGNTKWISLSANVYEIKNQRIMLLSDITQEKIVDTAKSEFVALATHQLRTPIAAIRWNLELLQKNLKETKTDIQNRYMLKIEKNTMRMIALINDFLSVSKLEMGTFESKVEEINLTKFFDTVVEEYTEKIFEKNIDVKRLYNPVNAVLSFDIRLFHIVISNLISNAVKYASDASQLKISYELIDKTLSITITNSGIGIPKAEINKLFTKFYRATNAQSYHAEGTGLGLYIVKQSVIKLGGTIDVTSDKDQETCFTVRLPY